MADSQQLGNPLGVSSRGEPHGYLVRTEFPLLGQDETSLFEEVGLPGTSAPKFLKVVSGTDVC